MSQTIPDNSGQGNAGEYDTLNNLWYTNYYGRNQITSATGLTSADAKTQAELYALHNGTLVFTKRDDVLPEDFRIFAYQTGTTFNSTEATQLKVVCDHDPDIVYNDVTTITAEDVDVDFRYTADLIVYQGQIYQEAFTYQMQFTSADYRTYTFNIPYTDSDTSRSNSISVNVEFVDMVALPSSADLEQQLRGIGTAPESSLPLQESLIQQLDFSNL